MNRYKRLEHTTDLKLKIFGKDKRDLLANAVFAMFDAILEKPLDSYQEKGQRNVEVKGADFGDLLINCLNELIYLNDVNNLAYQLSTVNRLTNKKLNAQLASYQVPSSQYLTEIKAATHHNLKVEKTDKGLEVVIVFDV